MTEFERRVVAANGGKFVGAQTALADAIGKSQGTVSRWCKGKSIPDPDVREDLAKHLKITVDQLMAMFPAGGPMMVAESASYIGTIPKRAQIPVYGPVRADRFMDPCEGPPLTHITPLSEEPVDYALRIRGDCMAPTILDGDDVEVRRRHEARDKEIVSVRLDGAYTIKRYRIINGEAWLVPDNKKYKSLKMTKHMVIEGVIRGMRRRL